MRFGFGFVSGGSHGEDGGHGVVEDSGDDHVDYAVQD